MVGTTDLPPDHVRYVKKFWYGLVKSADFYKEQTDRNCALYNLDECVVQT